MDINKLALELQQNQSVRQKIYAQYMNNQDDFFFQNFHGILEEKVLFEYLQHAQTVSYTHLTLPTTPYV